MIDAQQFRLVVEFCCHLSGPVIVGIGGFKPMHINDFGGKFGPEDCLAVVIAPVGCCGAFCQVGENGRTRYNFLSGGTEHQPRDIDEAMFGEVLFYCVDKVIVLHGYDELIGVY